VGNFCSWEIREFLEISGFETEFLENCLGKFLENWINFLLPVGKKKKEARPKNYIVPVGSK
jgi:hypothetical protein